MASSAEADRKSRAGRLALVDGMRAVAALTVVGYHAAVVSGLSTTGMFAPVLAELKAGVVIFFVISGFLLYLPYARAIRDRDRWPDCGEYARRRMVRIIPAYWVALTLFALSPLSGGGLGSDWWRYFGLLQNYSTRTWFGGLPVAWSLCVEISFYALLPLLAVGMVRLARRFDPVRAQLCTIACLGGASVLLRLWLAGSFTRPIGISPPPIAAGPVLSSALPGLFDWFALGLAMAVLRSEWEAGRSCGVALARLAQRPWLCLLIAVTMYYVGVPMQGGDMFLPLYGFGTHLALGLGAAAFVLPAAAVGSEALTPLRSGPAWLLSRRFAIWLGTISYGIYLWHVPFMDAVMRLCAPTATSLSPLDAIALFSVTVAGAIVFGAASWYLIERPAQRHLRSPRPEPAPSVAVGV